MAATKLGPALQCFQNLAHDHAVSQQTDGALLQAFLTRNDHVAFEALMRRHGPMV
jgi:hypothetical protein